MMKTGCSRKNFLKITGIGISAAMGLSACGDINSIPPSPPHPPLHLGPDPNPNDYSVYLGTGDTGILNFAFVQIQLLADFYTKVMANPYAGMTAKENRVLTDIKNHEIAHHDFFKAFLAENGIELLHFDFFSTDFNSRNSVLQTASNLQDVVVSAFNNFPELIVQTKYVVTIYKIASVEGRHAAAVKYLLKPNSAFFINSDIISPQGLDVYNSPVNALNILGPFIVERLDISELPKVKR